MTPWIDGSIAQWINDSMAQFLNSSILQFPFGLVSYRIKFRTGFFGRTAWTRLLGFMLGDQVRENT
jgi:hypothetical protein